MSEARAAKERIILVVCKGNICRSPMAEQVLRRIAAADSLGVTIVSAGLAAVIDAPVDPAAERVLLAHGLSAAGHRSRQITREDLDRADRVLAMEQRHLAALLALSPSLQGRAHLLTQWQDKRDIGDPFGRGQDAFDRAFALIESAANSWRKKL